MMDSIINVSGLTVSYGHKTVLSNIYLDIKPGQLIGVLGPNGAGKSTLFKSMLGLIEPTVGTIQVFGKDIDEDRKRIAYIPQKDEVDWDFPATARDVVAIGRYPHKSLFQQMTADDQKIIDQALEEMGITHLQKRQIGQLSGGQQQRVFLARALAQEADILFLDEPFVGVDITTEEKIITILKNLAKEGKTCLVVHHDLATVAEYFDHVILLNQRLVQYGPTPTIFNQENLNKTYGSQLTFLDE